MGTTTSSFLPSSWGCWSSRGRRRQEVRVLIDGIHPAGKTALLYKLKNPTEQMIATIPTIGLNVEGFCFEGHEITGWDLGGRDKIRPLLRKFFPETDAVIFVVDSAEDSAQTMEYSRDEFHRLLNEEELRGVPVLFFCNKQDLQNAKTPEQIANFYGISDYSQCGLDHLIMIQGCSVLEGSGVEEGLKKLGQVLVPRMEKVGAKSTDTEDEKHTKMRQAATKDKTFIERSNNVCMKRFEPIKSSTECPFAKSAKLWGGSSLFAPGTSIEDQAKEHAPSLLEFCQRANKGEPLDGFCIDIDDERARTGDPQEFGKIVGRMLMALADMDPSGENAMRVSYIGSPGWRFRFNKTDFFVTTFAPCYPEGSSRYGFHSGRAFILLQPELSFQRHDLPPDTAHTNWDDPKTIRDKIRIAFRNAGREYHIPESTRYPMADHIVKPLKDDGINVVYWWKNGMTEQ